MRKRVLVTGDRNWRNAGRVREALYIVETRTDPGTELVLIEGEAMGADIIAAVVVELDMIARPDFRDSWDRKWVAIERFPADWATHNRAAGPIRNQQMLDSGVDYVVGFHNSITDSSGTRDMLRRCVRADIPGALFTETEEVDEWQLLL
jgi:hypothetical protein